MLVASVNNFLDTFFISYTNFHFRYVTEYLRMENFLKLWVVAGRVRLHCRCQACRIWDRGGATRSGCGTRRYQFLFFVTNAYFK
ncbi:hypothetical protein HDG42_003425 [Paraburkholderia sp. JPY171]|nr:hypothetical protein [Paraburkholderia atlantica]